MGNFSKTTHRKLLKFCQCIFIKRVEKKKESHVFMTVYINANKIKKLKITRHCAIEVPMNIHLEYTRTYTSLRFQEGRRKTVGRK